MRREPPKLTGKTFDLLIIGGGILGAGIARDAAMRGLSVALIDKGDFASGTSSRSSKLIHGGFRYLEQFEFALVAESCRERRVLQQIAPQRVKPIPFLLPVYSGDPRPLWKMRLGMTLYDLLALYRNTARHRTLSAEAAIEAEPSLNPRGLRGAILYYDCQEDDARFCVDNILHAVELGAVCVNYCEAAGFMSNGKRVAAVRARDILTGDVFDVSARVIVNAAGPWVDEVLRLSNDGKATSSLSPTKGAHLLLPRVTRTHAFCFQARRDGRIMFVLPWNDCSIVGTTDTDFAGDPGHAHAEPADVDYLLEHLNQLIPNAGVGRADVITTFAGVRALLNSDADNPSARSREHRISRSGENLITVAGGKYTTYRLIARQVVDRVYDALGRRSPPCRTGEIGLPPYQGNGVGTLLSQNPFVRDSDIVRACGEEMATSVSDVMYRRTGLALSRQGNGPTAEAVSRLSGIALGWSETQRIASLTTYLEERRRGLPAG
jgi:glycerol-3-phosphate dehydrogenase